MEYLAKLTEMGIDGWVDFFIRFVMLLMISLAVLWLVYMILVKILGKRTKLHRDIFLRLQFMWALLILFALFNVYWFYFIKQNGIHKFEWASLTFYLDISVQVLLYLFIIILFVVSYSTYLSLLKK